MKVEYLKKMDRVARAVGSREPDDVLESLGYVFMDPGNSVDGFIMKRKGTTYYGVSPSLTGRKYDFGVMHEGFHGICGHLDLPGFVSEGGAHTDTGSFGNYKMVAGTERDANIGAADFIIDTQGILDMLGYDNADVAAYRISVESFDTAVRDYQRHFDIVVSNGSPESRIRRMRAYQRELARMYNELQEQAQDIMNSGICLSKYDIAREFGVPEFIIDYKFEALALRKYSVSTVELPTFDKVFSRWN